MGRFINADGFAGTGQGVLGNNMFAYCGNNPACRKDITGTRYCEATSIANESAAARSVACQFQGSVALERQTASKNTLIFTCGYYVCITVGAFNISGTIEPSFDLKGNTQLFSTVSFDVTTSGSLSISGGSTASVLLAPDTSYVKGDADYLGGGIACPIPYTPIAGTASTNILRTSDGYWGIGKTTGIAWPADSKVGGELHGGHSYSHAWLPQVNLFDFFNVF